MSNRRRHRSHSGRMRVPELKSLSDVEFAARLAVIREMKATGELESATADEWMLLLEFRATPEQLQQLYLLKQEALV